MPRAIDETPDAKIAVKRQIKLCEEVPKNIYVVARSETKERSQHAYRERMNIPDSMCMIVLQGTCWMPNERS